MRTNREYSQRGSWHPLQPHPQHGVLSQRRSLVAFGGLWCHLCSWPWVGTSGTTWCNLNFGKLGRLSRAVEPGRVANPGWASRKGKGFISLQWPRAAAGWELLWAAPCGNTGMVVLEHLVELEGNRGKGTTSPLKTGVRPSEGIHR